MRDSYRKYFIIVDLLYVGAVISMVLLNFVIPDSRGIFMAIFLALIGSGFIVSNKLKEDSKVAGGLCWISANLFVPRFKYNHIIWGSIIIIIGLASIIYGNRVTDQKDDYMPPGMEAIETWWYKDPMFYIVLLLLIAIGFYRTTTRNNK